MFLERSTRITLSVAIASMSIVLGLSPAALGQLEPDETLGEERSQIREISPVDFDIEGGARRGNNLFHSFREFNVNEGGSVYFVNPDGIQNILSRVTGSNPSNILGRLGVFGNANLFLINPNGIVFGPNTSLDVQGSFAATTADGIQFGEQGFFSATNPETPGLLTVNPSALFFNQLEAQPIVNQSVAIVGTTPAGNLLIGLQVPTGQSLVLAGGDVLMNGGLAALEGRVELGSIAGTGRIELEQTSSGLQLQFPANAVRSNVFLSGAIINVAGGNQGDIAIHAQDLTITGGSLLLAGYDFGLGTATSQAGDILLDATGAILIDQSSTVVNAIRQGAIGNAGDVNVNAAALTVNENGYIGNGLDGQGNAGDININVDGRAAFDYSTVINSVGADAIGNAGSTTINAGSVWLSNGTYVNSSTLGQGNAGNITINARDTVSVNSISSDGFRPSIFSRVEEGASGNGGDITINAGSVSLTDQARLDTRVYGQGNAGNISVTARDAVSSSDSAILSTALASLTNATGNGGNITINAGSVSLTDGTQLDSGSFRQGNGGNISIVARDTVSLDNSSIFSDVSSDAIGNSGRITIDTGSLFLSNAAQLRTINAGQGNAADVTVNARDNISLSNQSSIATLTEGRGNAGDIQLNAGNTISLDGENTAITSGINPLGIGRAGNIIIATGSLAITDSAQLFTNSFGQGNAGNIQITAQDAVLLARRGSIASSTGFGVQGSTGDIIITADSLTLTDNASISSNLFGRGNVDNTGDIKLTIDDTLTVHNTSTISASAFAEESGNGGNIFISTGSLFVTNSSGLSTITFGRGNAGDIQITARDQVTFAGRSSPDNTVSAASASVASGAVGNGGDITITAGSLLVNEGQISTATSGQGNAGNVEVTARDTVTLVNNGNIFSGADSNATGDAGNIRMDADNIRLLQNASLVTSTLGQGDAGNIQISALDTISFRRGGGLFAFTDGQGNAGNVVVEAGNRIILDGTQGDSFSSILSTVEPNGVGRGGNIRIRTGNLSVRDGAQIQVLTRGQGDAGTIHINARDRVLFDGIGQDGLSSGAFSTVEPTGIGDGGTIRVTAGSLSLTNNGQLVSSTRGQGNAGNVLVRVDDAIELRNGGLIQSAVAAGGLGDGGNVTVRGRSLLVLDGSQVGTFVARPQRDAQTGDRLPGGQGEGGDIDVRTTDFITLSGIGTRGTFAGFSSGLLSLSERDASGPAGNIIIRTGDLQITDGAIVAAGIFNAGGDGGNVEVAADNLEILNGGQILTNTRSSGQAGRISLDIADSIEIGGRDENFRTRREQVSRQIRGQNSIDRVTDIVINEGNNSGVFANTGLNSTGEGGRITVNSNNLTLEDGARISAQSQGTGTAGEIHLNVSEQLQLTDSDIVTNAPRSAGGDITVNNSDSSGLILLRGDSDITTNSQGNGGNITLRGSGIIAFDDSDILARSQDARGGNITLAPFFSANPALESEPPFDGNSRVDVNADGSIASGTITTPDTSLIQNSLTDLPENAIDADNLIANSCVVRSQDQSGTFVIAGAEGLPQRPGDAPLPSYATGTVRSAEENGDAPTWQMGDPIVEPQGMYRLQDGRMVLSREC